MTDEVILSALARGKPVSARRVQALADENARLAVMVQDMIAMCRAFESSVEANWSMYQNEKRMREDENRRIHELIHRMVMAEMRADRLSDDLRKATAARDEHYRHAQRLSTELMATHKACEAARKWGAHDTVLAAALREVFQ